MKLMLDRLDTTQYYTTISAQRFGKWLKTAKDETRCHHSYIT